MAKKIKRGLIIKRFYCSNCHKRADEDDSICQNCGQPFGEEFVEKKKAVQKQEKKLAQIAQTKKPAEKPKQAKILEEEEISGEEAEEEGLEEEMPAAGEEFEEAAPEEIPLKKTALFLPRFRTALWVIVAAMLLWGLFANDSMLLVAAVLVLVVIELEEIRKKLH